MSDFPFRATHQYHFCPFSLGATPGGPTQAPPATTAILYTSRPTTAGPTGPNPTTPPSGGNGGSNGGQGGGGADRVEADSVLLRWSSVPGSPAYFIEQRTAGGPYEYVTQTRGNEYLVENLEPYTDYTFRVSYYDQEGNLVEGAEISVKTAESGKYLIIRFTTFPPKCHQILS